MTSDFYCDKFLSRLHFLTTKERAMRKSLYTLLALIMINSSTAVKPIDHLVLDYGQRIIVTHPGIGPCEWSYDGQDFYVIYEGQSYQVDPLYIDKELIGISKKNLLRFLSCGYLYINRLDNGEFTIKAKGRLNGGFPIILAVIGAGIISGVISGIRGNGTPTYSEPINNFQAAQARIEANIAQDNHGSVQDPSQSCIGREEKFLKGLKKNDLDEIVIQGKGPFVQLSDGKEDIKDLLPHIIDEKKSAPVEKECLVGPGIPKLIPLPGISRPPLIKMIRPTQPMPILPGKTEIV